MLSVVNSKANKILEQLEKTAELASIYGSDDTKDLDQYKTLANNVCMTMCKNFQARRTVEICKDARTLEEYEETYAKNIQAEPPNPMTTKEYKSTMTKIEQLLQDNVNIGAGPSCRVQQDDMVMELEISDKDPITKRRMENPVKNKYCKHYYEKSSILSSIQLNPRLRCPVAGCGNKQYIRKDHLEDDLEFAQMLRRNKDN